MKSLFKYTLHLLLIILLTLLTQVGGLIYLVSLIINFYWNRTFKGKLIIVFCALYLLATFVVIPLIAPIGGREKIKHSSTIRAANYGTVLLNRNYTSSALHDILQNTEKILKENDPDIKIQYLDACFPFLDGFPLLPHLSHDDGNQIDLSFIYELNGEITDQRKSFSGYGVFVEPALWEHNQTLFCKEAGHWQYDYSKYFSFGSINNDLEFSESGTKSLVKALLKQKQLGKIFIEPHLKSRLKLRDKRIRFHGCHAVRHDDHIHLELK